MILPEWFFIDPITDTLTINIDADALRFMKQYPVRLKIYPQCNQPKKNMMVILMVTFGQKQYQRVLKEALINAIVSKLKQYQLQGII